MTLYQQLKQANLIDQYGLVTLVGQPEGSDNGVLFSTQYLLLSKKLGEPFLAKEQGAVCLAIESCFDYDRAVTRRNPHNLDQDSPDNTIAMAGYSTVYNNRDIAKALYWRHWPLFVYKTDSNAPLTTRAWLGRQIGLIGYLQACAGTWINPLRLLILAIGCYITSNADLHSTSDRLLTQLIMDTLPNKWYTRPLITWWNNKIAKQYPLGINDVVYTYFGPQHVFTQVWK